MISKIKLSFGVVLTFSKITFRISRNVHIFFAAFNENKHIIIAVIYRRNANFLESQDFRNTIDFNHSLNRDALKRRLTELRILHSIYNSIKMKIDG